MVLMLVAVLSACNLPGRAGSPTPNASQTSLVPVATLPLQIDPTQTGLATIIPTSLPATLTATPISTPISSTAPTWKIYNYTCELAVGGASMTMNLAWTDRSNSEEGYKVYRNEQVIATLAADSTAYVDIAFVATGKTLRYSVEAFNQNWHLSTSTITYGCQ
jgi:hypothetical protein